MTSAEVIAIVETTLGRRGVRLEDRLIQDLGAESMDLVSLAAALEDRFGIVIPQEELPRLDRVADLVACAESAALQPPR